jgi:hypothetical protein
MADAAPAEAEVPQEPQKAETVEPLPRSGGGPAILYDRYIINSDATIPDLDTPSAKAYSVEDRREAGSQLFALICTPGLPIRDEILDDLKASNMPGLMNLVDWGKVHWPPLNKTAMTMIYRRPMGGKVTNTYDSDGFRITEYDIPTQVISPLGSAIRELAIRKITHRAIRPNNLFYMDEDRTQMVLGDCATTPPGFDQPAIFDSLPAALASPGGRGVGDVKDDLFSLGITILFFLLEDNPIAEMELDDQVIQRAEIGTYQVLLKNYHLPAKMTEVLRGLLSDEPDERWGTKELEIWINGKRPSALPRKSLIKAEAPFKFGTYELTAPRALAHALTRNVPEAAKAIKSGNLEIWARSDLKIGGLADSIKEIAEVATININKADSKDDFVVSKVSLIMDPTGPIRYRGFSFMADGFGGAMAVEFLRRQENKFAAEVLSRNVPGLWFAAQGNSSPDNFTVTAALGVIGGLAVDSYDANFKELRKFQQTVSLGYGIERCLYEENRSLSCQSPNITQDYVTDIREILTALDRAANRADTTGKPIDRHVAAFIATHFYQEIEPHLNALGSPDEASSLIGMLSLLALMQWKLEVEPVYGLSSWMGGLLGPAINTYYNRTTRREIEGEIPKLVRQGSLPDLFDLIDNAERRKDDMNGFEEAQAEYATAEAEVKELTEHEEDRANSAESSGHHASAVTSFLFMAFIVTLVLIFS